MNPQLLSFSSHVYTCSPRACSPLVTVLKLYWIITETQKSIHILNEFPRAETHLSNWQPGCPLCLLPVIPSLARAASNLTSNRTGWFYPVLFLQEVDSYSVFSCVWVRALGIVCGIIHVTSHSYWLLVLAAVWNFIAWSYSVDGCLDRCQFGAITSPAALNIQSLSFGEHTNAFLLGLTIGVKLIGSRGLHVFSFGTDCVC